MLLQTLAITFTQMCSKIGVMLPRVTMLGMLLSVYYFNPFQLGGLPLYHCICNTNQKMCMSATLLYSMSGATVAGCQAI